MYYLIFNSLIENILFFQYYLQFFFKLLERFLLKISSTLSNKKYNNIILNLFPGCLHGLNNQLYDFLENWLDSEIAGTSVLQLMVSLIENDEKNQLVNRVSRDSMIIDQIIGISENNTNASDFTTASMRLILVLLKKSKTEKVILTKVTESFFDKIMGPVIGSKSDVTNSYNFTKEEVSQCIFCLLVLVEFSQIAKQAYFEKVCNILQMKSTQFVLAKGMFCEDKMICEAVFEISKFEYFPKEEVSKVIIYYSLKNKI